MTKASARRGLAPTAASTRQPRARPQPSSTPLKKTAKTTKAKKAGRPAKSLKDGSPLKSGSVGGGGVQKKRGRRRQSIATKTKKLKDAAKARKAKLIEAESGDDKDTAEDDDSPKPTKVFNDALKTSDLEWEVETLIDSKIEKDVRYYLVKWVGYPKSANTWEPEINLRNSTDLIAEFDDAYPNKP